MQEELDALNQPLSLRLFLKQRNNFHVHFWGPEERPGLGASYKEHPAYKKALAESPEFAALAEELQQFDFTRHELHEIEPPGPGLHAYAATKLHSGAEWRTMMQKLYQAYRIMRKYAKSDNELFA